MAEFMATLLSSLPVPEELWKERFQTNTNTHTHLHTQSSNKLRAKAPVQAQKLPHTDLRVHACKHMLLITNIIPRPCEGSRCFPSYSNLLPAFLSHLCPKLSENWRWAQALLTQITVTINTYIIDHYYHIWPKHLQVKILNKLGFLFKNYCVVDHIRISNGATISSHESISLIIQVCTTFN